jgi:DNA replication protein DnaC|tara:strand:- start:2956 stop:3528 length:573 start_codon:yes stop_codon:yes gene_type:complete
MQTIANHYKLVEDRAMMLIDGFVKTELYDILTEYFTSSAKFTDRGYDLKKGLLVCGSVGNGKTDAFNVFRSILEPTNKRFKFMECDYLVRDYKAQGDSIIDVYGRRSVTPTYFDDLGSEEMNIKVYGNNMDVMGSILNDRYKLFKDNGLKTYVTTNLTPDQISDLYGVRMRDRLKEMMNYITVSEDSFRK